MTTVRDRIEAAIETLVECLSNNDAAGVADHYTDDAALLPPEAARVDGREGIQGYWQALIDSGVRDVALTTREVDDFGDVANEVGRITATAPGKDGGRVPLAGKYVAVWKRRDDGTWQVHRDIWNFDA